MKDRHTVTLDTVEKLVEVPLAEDEVTERGDLAAQLCAKIADAKEARQLAAKAAKDEIDRMDADMRQALREVRLRRVERMVACDVVLDPAERAVSIIRTDTGEVLSTRPARESELQIELVPPPRARGKGRKAAGADD